MNTIFPPQTTDHLRTLTSDSWWMHEVTEQVSRIAERRTRPGWLALGLLALTGGCLLVGALGHLATRGIGVWGNQQSVGWAWDIAGFVFWIGIGHAGTLISAILFLFRQHWRASINRAAEAATLFAVMTAAIYPLFHLGRVWLAYWLVPAPNQMLVWPNFKSPLTWDVFAITTYFTVSLLFWYLGMLPDLATLRDRACTPLRRRVLAALSLGWRSSQRHWQFYERTYLTLAGLSTALVISVHTIVSFDFAVSILPGWHNTIFPPYFVAGAILSGSAMVGVILVLLRGAFGLSETITQSHLEKLNKLVLAMSWMVAAAYLVEQFLAWYSDDPFEQSALFGRTRGYWGPAYLVMLLCNCGLPQLYWVDRVRRSPWATVAIGVGVSLGMWLERFVIVVSGLDRTFLPATWFPFAPTIVDVATLVGTFGLFFLLYLAFVRWVPIISMSEVKAEELEHDATEELEGFERSRGHLQCNELVDPRQKGSSDSRTDDLDGTRQLVLGRCEDIESLLCAFRGLRFTTARNVDAHAPLPIREVAQHFGVDTSVIAWSAGTVGVLSGGLAMAAQWWTQAVHYPLVMAGKSAWAWQTAVPIAFEMTILGAALAALAAFAWSCQLPRTNHPLLCVDRFRAASDNGVFISAEVLSCDTQRTIQALRTAGVHGIVGVKGR